MLRLWDLGLPATELSDSFFTKAAGATQEVESKPSQKVTWGFDVKCGS